MTPPVDLVVEDRPDPAAVDRLEDAVHRDVRTRTGIGDEIELAVFARQDGRMVGGIHGSTWGRCCELSTLWVEPGSRDQGLGSALLVAAQDEARRRGCIQVVLFTHDFQSSSMYRRLGYAEAGRVEDYPPGSAALWLRKALTPDGARKPR